MLKSSGTPRPQNLRGLRLTFRTLHYPNYRLFFGGQLVSLTGTWMQQVAVVWLVYRLTNSPFLLGLVGFAGQIPILLSPLAGVVVDRFNKHRILVVTQLLSLVQALALAVLTLAGAVSVWHIIVLNLFLGLINAVDMPTRQSFLVEMIENKEDLSNAIALNSSMFNGARLIGPSIAGLVIAALGEGPCFLLNALSYVAVLAALMSMKISRPQIRPPQNGVITNFQEGFRYAFGFSPIRSILLLIALVSVVGMPFSILMPVFARDILQGGPSTLGFLMSAVGSGALAGALSLASRQTVVGLGRRIPISAALFGAGLILFSLSRIVWLSGALLFIAGFGMMVQMAASNTILQTIVDDDKRGRVMSFYTSSFMGMAPFGSLLAGSFATTLGAPNTLLLSGTTCIIGAAVFALKLPSFRRNVRPIYARLGIIPEISAGLQTSTQLSLPPEN